MKKTTTIIICDACNADISPEETNYPHKFILRVSVEDVARRIPIVLGDARTYGTYAIAMYPPINGDLYFCGLECMTKYNPRKEPTPTISST